MTPGGSLQQVGRKQDEHATQREFFDRRVARGIHARNAVVGEHRNHPPAHHGQDEQDDIESNLKARPFRPREHAQVRKVERQHGEPQQQQQCDEEVVPPVPALHDGDAYPDGDGHRKRRIDDCRGCGEWRQDQHAAGHPKRCKCHQRHACGRRLPGPGANGREQEPGTTASV